MALRQIGHGTRAFAAFQRGERLAFKRNRAIGRHEAGECAQQGRLAGAIRPDQHGELAAAQREACALDDGHAAEPHRDVARG